MKPFLLALLVLIVPAATCQAAPTIASPPTISGDLFVGQRLEAIDTLVDEATDADLTLSWERSTDTSTYAEIVGAHDTSYLAVIADGGRRLRVHVVLETATGTDEAWSPPTSPLQRPSDAAPSGEPLRLGAAPNAPAALARWIVRSGSAVEISGHLPPDQLEAVASVVLEPTVAGPEPVLSSLTGDEQGRISGTITPTVNAVAWLVLDSGLGAPQRIRLGVIGVRPQIRLRLAASRDGLDVHGRTLIRDLTVLAGSTVAPGVAGLHFSWEGILPGERSGTAVCRSRERVRSKANGALRGGCGTRGAWSRARWRLVYDPGTGDPGSSPYLAATSVWVQPRLHGADVTNVPILPRAYANLRVWN